MPKKPSRSEIESALAGHKKTANRARTPQLQLDSNAGRRQTVIGGDLSGVSKRSKKGGWFSWLRDTNYVNWLAIAIVGLIILAFFWPSAPPPITEEVGKLESKVEIAPYYSESRIDDEREHKTTSQSFDRDTDFDRASAFREQEQSDKQINELLSKAEAHVAKGEYSSPPESNAVTAYKKILELDPKNLKARNGLEYISGRFPKSGVKALEDKNLNLANGILSRLAAISTQSSDYLSLSGSIASWKKQQQISTVLNKAKASMKLNNLILPARDNALYYYQQALQIDSTNKAANAGMKAITDRYIEKANAAVLAGQAEAGKGYLATVSVIDPKNPSIPMIEKMLLKVEQLSAKNAAAARQQKQAQQKQPEQAKPTTKPVISVPPARPSKPSTQSTVSAHKTPQQEANEQELFDRQYLQRGLDAYYRGDYNAAVSLLQPLADKGVSRAQLRIAYMHYLGRGYPKNSKEADRIIRAALPAIKKFAEQGRGWAQSDLGSLYEDGLVLPRDYNEAIYWYRSAAEKGYAGAQTNLGIMYAQGHGVSSSRRTAIEWFQRTAKQGDVAAKRNLESMGISP